MHHREFKSPNQLSDAIKCFWYNDKQFGEQPSSFEVVPDGYAEIIFHFGGACSIMHNGGLQPLPSPFMMGLLNRPAVFYAQHRLQIIGVRYYPWSVFDLLGLQPTRGGVHTFQHAVAGLQPALQICINDGRTEDAIATVEQYFVDARHHVAVDSMLHKAGVAMTQANGTLPVSEVAAAAHATVRTLQRRFMQSSGHSVKDVSGLMRFEQVRNHLWHHPAANLAALAFELGYTDQSHLNREFKRYSGATPAAFARKAKKGQQAMSSDFVAFVQA